MKSLTLFAIIAVLLWFLAMGLLIYWVVISRVRTAKGSELDILANIPVQSREQDQVRRVIQERKQ